MSNQCLLGERQRFMDKKSESFICISAGQNLGILKQIIILFDCVILLIYKQMYRDLRRPSH